jgi:Lon protease-like protein
MSELHVPVFPLPLVLYPGQALPLHIFEPRYRQLLADLGGVEGRFAIVLVEADADDAESARLHTVGCMARITSMETLPDGRSNIMVMGEERIRLLDWEEEQRPYATGTVLVIDEDLGSDNLAHLVRERFTEYVAALFTLVKIPAPTIPEDVDSCELSYWVAGSMHLEPAEKQHLLRCPTTDERLAMLLQLLSREMQRVSTFSDLAHQQGKQFVGGVPFSVN